MQKTSPLVFIFLFVFFNFNKFISMQKQVEKQEEIENINKNKNIQNNLYNLSDKNSFKYYNNCGTYNKKTESGINQSQEINNNGGGGDGGSGGGNNIKKTYNVIITYYEMNHCESEIKTLYDANMFIEKFNSLLSKNQRFLPFNVFTHLEFLNKDSCKNSQNYFFSFLSPNALKENKNKEISSDFLIKNIESYLKKIKERKNGENQNEQKQLKNCLDNVKALKNFIDKLYLSIETTKNFTIKKKNENDIITLNTKEFLDDNLKFKKLNYELERIIIKNSPLNSKEIFLGSLSMIIVAYLLYKSGKLLSKKTKKQ
jgi:hypothetical protein